jgi:mycothiol S-conjugate amidase
VAVHLICATRGECGTVDPDIVGDQSIADLRTAELLCAATALGVQAVHLLGYRDSGMPNAPDAQHPAALVAAPLAEVTERIVAVLRAFRPHVVVTHGPFGGYGHPDHVRVSEATVAAMQAVADAARFPDHTADGLGPWPVARLYYDTFAPGPVRFFGRVLRLLGRDPRRSGANRDVDLVAMADGATPITCRIAVGPWLAARDRAFRCHRSQLGGRAGLLRVPRPIRRLLLGTEDYTEVGAPRGPDRPIDRDFIFGHAGDR